MAKTVCLDAGHFGQYNRSPRIFSYYESERMWILHNFLAEELQAFGIKVIKTRHDLNTDLALVMRGRKAEGCDLFLSLHSNAEASGAVDYPLACCLVDDNKTGIDEQSLEVGLELAKRVAEVMGTTGTARTLQRKLDSGADYYGVLRGAKSVGVPAVLLEHSFHTNTRATNWLLSDANLRTLAKAEAAVIANWLGVAAPPAAGATAEWYRVQTGAFLTQKNAQRQLEELRARGFAAIIVKVGGWYKVQLGAFRYQTNAKGLLRQLEAAGYKGIIATDAPKAVSVEEAKKSVEQLAREVLAGKWGVNPQRQQRLEAAGYDYRAVQTRVNQLL